MIRNIAMTGRKTYVDCMKAIGIILVILGHIDFANATIKPWIYSFHMPLFFFATGLVMKRCDLNICYVLKKFRALMVPYFIWALLFAGWSLNSALWILYGSHQSMLMANTLTSLWFLPAMFLSVLIIQLVIRFLNKPVHMIFASVVLFGIGVAMPKISVGYPWCIDVSLIAASIILLGYTFETTVVPKIERGGYAYGVFYL